MKSVSLATLTLLVALVGASAGPLPTRAGAGRQLPATYSPTTGSSLPLLAIAIQGKINVLQTDGSLRQLTTSGIATLPTLSPNARMVAYISGTKYGTSRVEGPFTTWIVPTFATDGAAYRFRGEQAAVSDVQPKWSPDGKWLAYFQSGNLALRSLVTRAETILRPPAGMPFFTRYRDYVAWSPDSRSVAVPISRKGSLPLKLEAVVFSLDGRTHHRIVATFPAGALGRRNGNYPISIANNDLTWMPDGRHFQFSSVWSGTGLDLTGIWQVGIGGGVAHLVVGTAAWMQSIQQPPASPFDVATHWVLSPDHFLMAMDPARGLWIATIAGKQGRYFAVPQPPSCQTIQFAWWHNSKGLAYVQICLVPGSPPAIQSTLYSRALSDASPRRITRVVSQYQTAIDIGEPYRCVACGG